MVAHNYDKVNVNSFFKNHLVMAISMSTISSIDKTQWQRLKCWKCREGKETLSNANINLFL